MTNDRGREITRRLAWQILLALAGCTGTRRASVPIASGRGEDPAEILGGLVSAHNRERKSARLPALVTRAELEASARRHVADMAARNKMSHRGSDHSSPFQRMEQEGYQFQRAAENIALGEFTLDSLMTAWMKSPPHRRNILGNFSEIGAAYAIAEDGRSYWCVTFGTPLAA